MAKRKFLTALGVAATLLGLFLLYRVFQRHDLAEVAEAALSAPSGDLALAAAFTVVSFTCIAVMEYLAIRYVGRPVHMQRIARTAVAAVGIGRAVGVAALSSGTIRYRMYGRAGFGVRATGTVLLFSGLSVSLGFAGMGGTALIVQSTTFAPIIGLSPAIISTLGAVALAYVAGYLIVCVVLRTPIRIGRFHLRLPPPRLAGMQVVVSNLNILSIGAVLYFALRGYIDVHYATAAALYVGSDMSALIAHVPGGWGVLEFIVTSALDGEKVIAGVVLFRAIYYLLPLGVGLVLFVLDELAGHAATRRSERTSTVDAT